MIFDKHNTELGIKSRYKAVSLFSNCGAGDVGYKRAGFQFEVMAELLQRRLKVCLMNHSDAVGVQGDLRETWQDVVDIYRTKTKNAPLTLLAACPPCQGMSSARGLRGTHEDADAGSRDERNLLAVVIANVAKELNPQIIVVENVPEFFSKKVRHPETLKSITASNLLIEFLEDRYMAFPVILDMSDFGIPQSRKRSFLTFIRYESNGLKHILQESLVPYPRPLEQVTSLADALRELNLPMLDASCRELASADVDDTLPHSVPVFEPHRYEMVAAIPPNSGKSAWTNNTCANCSHINDNADAYCSVCNTLLSKPTVKDANGKYRLIKGFNTSYKRMQLDKPAATVLTTSGTISSHNTIHPFENRVLSLVECARLQTIDKDFVWGDAVKKWGHSPVRAMIGEAVPPKFTEMHGNVLMSIIKEKHESMMSVIDKRHQSGVKALKRSKKIVIA